MVKPPHISILSETVISLIWGLEISPERHQHILWLKNKLEQANFPQFLMAIPAYHSLTVFFGEGASILGLKNELEHWLHQLLERATEQEPIMLEPQRLWQIPVYYGGENGADLVDVARHNGLSEQDVIRLHTKATYYVYMIGFTVGFPYLGGLNKQLFTPRRSSPRLHVQAGSVGIGGEQTGVYPLAAPGGWQIIGRTDFNFFLDGNSYEAKIRAGDTIQFIAIQD